MCKTNLVLFWQLVRQHYFAAFSSQNIGLWLAQKVSKCANGFIQGKFKLVNVGYCLFCFVFVFFFKISISFALQKKSKTCSLLYFCLPILIQHLSICKCTITSDYEGHLDDRKNKLNKLNQCNHDIFKSKLYIVVCRSCKFFIHWRKKRWNAIN